MNYNSTGAIEESVSQDRFILTYYGLNELHFESVKNYRQQFEQAKPDHPWNRLEIKEFLYKIGAWGKRRDTNTEGLTLAGLLMFSEERIITEVLPQYFLVYQESFSAITKEEGAYRLTSQDGTWSGNIYDFYFEVMNRIPVEQRGGVHELLMNAILHADYTGDGGIVIEKQEDAFQFSNPGISVEQGIEVGHRHLRNPSICKMFTLIDLCQRAGTGLHQVKTLASACGWEPPHFLENPDQQRITVMWRKRIQEEGNIGVEEDVFEEWDNSVNKEENSCNSEDNSLNKDYNSYNKDYNSCNSEYNSCNNEIDSVNSEDNSYNSEDNSYNNDFADDVESQLGEEVREEVTNTEEDVEAALWNIGALAREKKRLSPDVMETIIVKMCQQRPLMLKEFAHLLERTPDGLRNNYLAKLLDKGKIQLRYPHQPNHPRQAYFIERK